MSHHLLPEQTLEWLRSAVGGVVRSVETMPESSHANHHVVVETPSGTHIELVLRRYTDADRLGADPWYDPHREVEALETLSAVDLPVPRLVAADVEPAACDVPTLLITWLPGVPPQEPADSDAFVRGLARPLPSIHDCHITSALRTYDPYFVSDGAAVSDLRPPAWSGDPTMWERAIEALDAGGPSGPERFIHRDYHHGNTLWLAGELTGIVDWTTGCVGPPGIDLAHVRLNLAWDFDLELADAFLITAERSGVTGHHPYWDLLDAAEWLSDDPPADQDEAIRHERYEAFVRQALSELR